MSKESSKEPRKEIDCPSAPANAENARVFGMYTGAPGAHRVGYLTEALPVSDKLLALAGDAEPTQVFRIAGRCDSSGCNHFRDNSCTLAQRIVEGVRPVVNALPLCQIRSTCRWFRQEGKAACFRCPQVVTNNTNASDHEKQIADDG
jgi:hypothetical protein